MRGPSVGVACLVRSTVPRSAHGCVRAWPILESSSPPWIRGELSSLLIDFKKCTRLPLEQAHCTLISSADHYTHTYRAHNATLAMNPTHRPYRTPSSAHSDPHARTSRAHARELDRAPGRNMRLPALRPRQPPLSHGMLCAATHLLDESHRAAARGPRRARIIASHGTLNMRAGHATLSGR